MKSATDIVDPEMAAQTIVALDNLGRIRTGAQAIFTIAGQTGGAIGIAGKVLSPRPISVLFEPGYRLFARNRGRFARWFKDPD